MSMHPSSASVPSIWPWRAIASLKGWPQLQKTAPRTGTEMCCPVSLKLLLTSFPGMTGSTLALAHPLPQGGVCPLPTFPS